MLERLAHIVVRRRWWVIGVWIALTLVGAFSAGQLSKRWFQSFSIPGYSGYETSMAEKLAHDLEWIADRSVRLYMRTLVSTGIRVLGQTFRGGSGST